MATLWVRCWSPTGLARQLVGTPHPLADWARFSRPQPSSLWRTHYLVLSAFLSLFLCLLRHSLRASDCYQLELFKRLTTPSKQGSHLIYAFPVRVPVQIYPPVDFRKNGWHTKWISTGTSQTPYILVAVQETLRFFNVREYYEENY